MSNYASSKMKAADLLLKVQAISIDQHITIEANVKRTGERAEEVMIDAGVMSEAELLRALSGAYRTHFVSTEKLSKAEIPRATVQMVPRRVAETLAVFPVMFDAANNVLSVVTPDPDNASMLREIQLVSGAKEVKAFVTRPAAITAAILKHHAGDPRAFGALERAALGNMAFDPHLMGMTSMDPQPPAKRPASFAPPPIQAHAPPIHQIPSVALPPVAPPAPPPPPPAPAPVLSPPTPGYGFSPVPTPAAPVALEPPPPPAPPPVAAPLPKVPEPEPSAVTSSSGRRTNSGFQNQLAAVKESARDSTTEILSVMVSLLENSRAELRGHSSQVTRFIKRVAERMKLDKETVYAITVASFVHDIGKMGQFHLTALNVAEYEGHKIAAQKAYDTPLRLLESVGFTSTIRDSVFHMYERFDGKGFPDGLVGKEIPLGARLLAVADTYADLTQNPRNPFRKTLSPQEAVGVLQKHQGEVFDPSLVDLFKSIVLGEGLRNKLLANRYSVLVVDADPEETAVLELRMVEQGFDVKIARTIDAAKKALKEGGEGTFDLVLGELEMPDGNGLDLLEKTRSESWGKELPWVVFTNRQAGKEAQKAFALGALDFVAKPMSSEVLVAKLKAMLDQWATGRGAKGVSGSLREMGLPDIVQVLNHGRKTGKLNVRSGGEMGEIHFQDGDVVHAIFGKLRGTHAFYALLKLREGDFGLDPSFTPTVRVIEESPEMLLLEGMRRLDEGLA